MCVVCMIDSACSHLLFACVVAHKNATGVYRLTVVLRTLRREEDRRNIGLAACYCRRGKVCSEKNGTIHGVVVGEEALAEAGARSVRPSDVYPQFAATTTV